MSSEPEYKKVKPRDPKEIDQIRAKIKKVDGLFAEILAEMAAGGLKTVTLGLGTAVHFLDKLEPEAEKLLGKTKAQRAEHATREAREKAIAERPSGKRKIPKS